MFVRNKFPYILCNYFQANDLFSELNSFNTEHLRNITYVDNMYVTPRRNNIETFLQDVVRMQTDRH